VSAALALSVAAAGTYAVTPAFFEDASGKQTTTVKELTLVAEEVELEIAPGERVKTWTFNGTVPGPTLRFTEGDNVSIKFINKTPIAHTIHLHGNHDDESDGVLPQVMPGETYTYRFVADPAGALMYHCHAYPTSLHIRMGMYGALIIDPKEPMEPAREFAVVMGEFDPEDQESFVPKYYLVNGYADQYMEDNALHVNKNELVRLYVINMGTTIPSSFHLHSTIFKAYPSGLPSNEPIDAQTIEVGPGNAAIVEARWKWPGMYLFHSHGLQEERGNMGEIHVSEEDGSGLDKSVSMIGWQYNLQKKLQAPSSPVEYEQPVAAQAQERAHGSSSNHDGLQVAIAEGSWESKQNKESYVPSEIAVAAGSKVAWVNEDSVAHTVTEKGGQFDSSIVAAGATWSHQFDDAGTFDYYCALHPWMEGKVAVE
jgi:plastocyanin